MKHLFLTAAGVCAALNTGQAQAQHTESASITEYPAPVVEPAGETCEGADNKIIHQGADGYWILHDARADGGDCSVTYVATPPPAPDSVISHEDLATDLRIPSVDATTNPEIGN